MTLELLDNEISHIKNDINFLKKEHTITKKLLSQYYKHNDKIIKELKKSLEYSNNINKQLKNDTVNNYHNSMFNIKSQIMYNQNLLVPVIINKMKIPLDNNQKIRLNNLNIKLKELNLQIKECIDIIKKTYFLIQSQDSEEMCTITLDTFKKNNIIFKGLCNHKFKYKGIKLWVIKGNKSTCPVCRDKLIEDKYFNLFKKYII